MKLESGMVIKTPALVLKVEKVVGRNAICQYWDANNQAWKSRGYAEKVSKLNSGVESGVYEIMR